MDEKRRQQIREANRRWRATHPKHVKAYNIKYYGENTEKYRELNRRWFIEHEGYRAAANAKHYAAHREEHLEKCRAYRLRLRETVFNHYGNKCTSCGEDDFYSLEIHHRRGGGLKHRKHIGVKRAGVEFYRWLIKKGFPKDFETLCSECNKNYYHKNKDIII